ncbi:MULTISPECIES: VOC family protein [Methylosinus]|uniref:Glyoxalase n=1 Tax=Methylosinus trichosporium (strain ATCC 35070 / NCIMB 11131 / UNIQEM 75 / OB3b) TaxID=595536 RepID=A0A2D2D550_METT3|nr:MULTISPECIES: VOC family protein [Methylosinus]ATQ70161.1 glyoxalase [Methylosinus trichosporium OB3b]OBS53411.1 glyoxalase [Methylosinus sp. 3S-1]
MPAPSPRIDGCLETAIYVDDLARAAGFYEKTLGLSPMYSDERLVAFDCGPRSVLLLFLRGATLETVRLPGGEIPPHDGCGKLHFALAAPDEDIEPWERRLQAEGVAIEARMQWPRGGRSLYFRDPDGNLVEIASPGLWANY